MDEKRKPFVTISFRKPELSRAIVAASLAFVVIVGAFGIQEVQRWQRKMLVTEARLYDAEGALAEANARLDETEGALTEATSRLNEAEGKLTQTTSRLHESEGALTETTAHLHETETRLNETEAKLQETEAELLEAKKQLEAYLPVGPLNEPIAFLTNTWGVEALTCIRMPQGYWTGWESVDGIGRLLYYSAREWDTVEAIHESAQYALVGEDEWSAYWDEDKEEGGYESDSYFMHVAVLESQPFTWSKSKDWFSNKESWQGRLTDYCSEALQP